MCRGAEPHLPRNPDTARGAPRFGHLVDLELIGAPLVGEEQDVVVGIGHEEALHGILLARDHAQDALAAAPLRAVGRAGDALDVAPAGHRHNDLVGRNQVFVGQRIDRGRHDARAARVAFSFLFAVKPSLHRYEFYYSSKYRPP